MKGCERGELYRYYYYYLFGGLIVVGGFGMEIMKVGVILDFNSWVGNMSLNCINISLSDFYASHPQHNTTILLHLRDSKADPLTAATQAMELIQKSEVEAILGPEKWLEAYLIMKMGEKAEVPIISFAPTISTLSSLNSSYLFRVAQNHSSQVAAISDMVRTFSWKQVVAIYEDDEIGKWIVADLTNALQDAYVRVHRTVINPPTASSDQIREELYRLSLMQGRVFVVHMRSNLASRVFAMANEMGMMREGYAWIVTDAIANVLNTLNASTLSSMQGVLGLKTYVPKTEELHNFITRWRRKFPQAVDVFGLWAYDAAWALAMASERSIGTNPASFTSGVSRNGKKIRESLLGTKFRGLSGEFNLIKGQLEWPNLELVNVIGNRVIPVGYWRPEMGLTGKFDRKGKLRTIIWPGYSVTVPKRWGTRPLNNKQRRLRIGVVMHDKFTELARPDQNGSAVGYYVDIFEAVIAQLPYDLLFKYIPLESGDKRSSSASIDNLIFQVFEGQFDALIGDITIRANRSLYVDFTPPFTEAGIGAVIPVKHSLRNHEWVFLKPLTLKLWITSFFFFIFMTFVVWILEHRNHEEFHGPPSRQIGTSLWFSFSTIVFAHWETLVSNLARLVVVIWFFVVFILTQSYTASLTSWLTVQQLQPLTDISQIVKNNWHVGYLNGSYVLNTLQRMGIKHLVPYDSIDQLHELFINGSRNGGIDAVIDEIPYLKLFLSRYNNDYIMADSIFKGNGFGFAFPLGSSIVKDMSEAMLNMTESDRISKIHEKWFGKKYEHQLGSHNSSEEDSSSSLDLSYFWSLFLIAASVAIFALLFYFFFHLRRSLRQIYSAGSTVWRRIVSTFHIFSLKDSYSCQEGAGVDEEPSTMTVVEASPTTNNARPSPSDDSVHSPDQWFNEFGDDTSHQNQASLEIIHG